LVEGPVVVITASAPSPLSPAGSEAHRLAGLWWLLLVLAAAVVVLVIVLAVVAMFRPADGADEGEQGHRRDQRFIVGGGLVMPVVILAVAGVATVTTTQALRRPHRGELRVEVTGEQWFWRVHYPVGDVTTANEIRLPEGQPVDVVIRSADVAHSFWVPQLAGKVDAIPGQTNHLRFTADRIGTYRGECAEFCGLQHAHMAFVVRVVSADRFERWLHERTSDSVDPAPGSQADAGRRRFATSTCAGCHTVRGVSDGTRGPDLSDLGSRPTLGAGTLVNDPAHLTAWIRNPQDSKPGAHMPPTELSSRDIAELVAYLESLHAKDAP
jgi:cytochrome c oxidase subunit 2